MAKTMFLSFEQPIAELNAKIEELRPLIEQYARACADLAALITKQR